MKRWQHVDLSHLDFLKLPSTAMSTPFNTWTFAGDVTINGMNSPKYNGLLFKINASPSLSDPRIPSYNLQGNKLTLTFGQTVNVLNYAGGRVTGTLNLPGYGGNNTVTLDGTGSFS
jgi:hypothetical protein